MTHIFGENNLLLVLASFITSLVICYISIPTIIKVSIQKQLYDKPDQRKKHKGNIPTLGGLAIFAGFMFSVMMWEDMRYFNGLQYVIASVIVLFFLGLKDDILVTAPFTKLIGQIIATTIIIFFADIRITSLYGIFGITQLPYFVSILLTYLIVLFLINSVNLIDGIDGLASGLGILVCTTFGIWFYKVGYYHYTIFCASCAGALSGFFRFNVFSTQNKIFMGDTGSLILGMIAAVLAISFMEINTSLSPKIAVPNAPAVVFGILIIPIFDTLRIIFVRMINNKNIFKADNNHIHHRLIAMGLTHRKATSILLIVNVLFIIFSFNFSEYVSSLMLISIDLIISILLVYLISLLKVKHNKSSVLSV